MHHTNGTNNSWRISNDMDEGLRCLLMIACHFDRNFSADNFKSITEEGAQRSLKAIGLIAEKAGLRARIASASFSQLRRNVKSPCILRRGNGFIVLFPRKGWSSQLTCGDPKRGIIKYTRGSFLEQWPGADASAKVEVLMIDPTLQFYNRDLKEGSKWNSKVLLKYFRHSYPQIAGVLIAFLITSLIQLIFPFLMQSVVDIGIQSRDISFILIVLLGQLVLEISRLTADLIRNRLLFQLSMNVTMSALSDFWVKLTHLPISYFDRNRAGDLMQRINDNRQVRSFLTGQTFQTFFSAFNFIIFAIVLVMYKAQLFLIFCGGILLYVIWILNFLGIRRKVNYELFHASSKENDATLQMVQGMQEIRLQNIEQLKRWEWESTQENAFRLNFKSLNYAQWQQVGTAFINRGKDMVLTFVVAKLVIEGQLTVGAMFAIEYIIGQLSGPVDDFIRFIQSAQDTKISVERLSEIHKMKDEEKLSGTYIRKLPPNKSISIHNLSFSYPGADKPVLNRISLEIPEGKTTAIIGVSGSGKTTLLKLLLKFNDSYSGSIEVGGTDFRQISPTFWRHQCGAVMQDGFIFNDTILNNISFAGEHADFDRLMEVCHMANFLSFVEDLKEGFNTRLGTNGIGISQGQKQRLLIARAMYKNPGYLLFDEATNALDAENEKMIINNLHSFFRDRTVLVVAHRLSTVRLADKIVVLHGGEIIEQGNHYGLTRLKGRYFELVKNQLDLEQEPT
ncbi:MAG TPA: peptidase domain-containing ABC transporter [Flavipsychrobacter sp.]|nr:peptidase domain-containing ABC transporter [Flavipsychrobacter sp.]